MDTDLEDIFERKYLDVFTNLKDERRKEFTQLYLQDFIRLSYTKVPFSTTEIQSKVLSH